MYVALHADRDAPKSVLTSHFVSGRFDAQLQRSSLNHILWNLVRALNCCQPDEAYPDVTDSVHCHAVVPATLIAQKSAR